MNGHEPDGCFELLGELAVGAAYVDAQGAVARANPSAQDMLDGGHGDALRQALAQLCQVAARTEGACEAIVGDGTLRVVLTRSGGAFVAAIERLVTARLRAEIQTLRGLLATLSVPGPAHDSLAAALAPLAATLPRGWVALFECDERSGALVCLAQAGVPQEHRALLQPQRLAADASIAARAAALAIPVHVADLSRSPFEFERQIPDAERCAALALPAGKPPKPAGALLVCGPRGTMGEGEMRLAFSLADAAGTLLERARQDRALRDEREARRVLADEVSSLRARPQRY